jgi:PAS domain S-box-containing protein
MEVELQNPAQEITRLQQCLNDLASILAIPGFWDDRQPSQIVETLLDMLFSMLHLDLAYLRTRPEQICDKLHQLFGDDPQAWPPLVTIEIDRRNVSILPVRLGVQGQIGLIMAGSHRAGFPQQTESLLLGVAANQASIALQDSALNEQRRVVAERDQKVRASEHKLCQVIDTIPALVWCSFPDGPNEFLNKRWHDYTGLTPEQSAGWGWQVVFHPEDLPPIMEKWRKMLVSGEPDEIESRLRGLDGIYRWFLIRGEPFRDDSGKIVRWYGTCTKIDDRKRAEEKLRRSEAFLREGQRLSQTGSFSWHVATDQITWSEQLYRIYELEIGRPVTLEVIRTRVHPEDLTLYEKMVEQARNGADDFEWQYRLMMPDHSIKYLHAVARATRDQDGQLEYIASIQDVTERRVSEEARDKARSELAHVARVMSLGTLTASIAHELNQPLSGIVTNASTCTRMLASDPPNVEGARETARRTIRDGNRASEVITRLRALFSKKESTIESVDLNDATREVIALSMNELQRGRVILHHELAEDLPAVTGDRIQLQQVILNLLRNASDAMISVDDRPRELLITTERDEGDQVRVSIKDVGMGLDRQGIERLFDAFYTTKNGGMGIGLSVSRSIVENHHGRLWASLNEGPGATFSFSIPCRSEVSTAANGSVHTPPVTEAA